MHVKHRDFIGFIPSGFDVVFPSRPQDDWSLCRPYIHVRVPVGASLSRPSVLPLSVSVDRTMRINLRMTIFTPQYSALSVTRIDLVHVRYLIIQCTLRTGTIKGGSVRTFPQSISQSQSPAITIYCHDQNCAFQPYHRVTSLQSDCRSEIEVDE